LILGDDLPQGTLRAIFPQFISQAIYGRFLTLTFLFSQYDGTAPFYSQGGKIHFLL
jgi:hypothetical protein